MSDNAGTATTGVLHDAGFGTTPGMWEILNDMLCEYEAQLPVSLNEALYALRDGTATVVRCQSGTEEQDAEGSIIRRTP